MKQIKLTCPIKSVNGKLSLIFPESYQDAKNQLMDYCVEKRGSFISITLSAPKTKKSTGRKSQNSHFHGHCATIAESTGQPVEDVKKFLKAAAVTRGYPLLMRKDDNGDPIEPLLDFWGQIQGDSMQEISSEECSFLIEQSHQFAAEMNIKLEEGENGS